MPHSESCYYFTSTRLGLDNGQWNTGDARGDMSPDLPTLLLCLGIRVILPMDNGELLFMLLRGTLGPWLNTWLPASTFHNGKWKT